MHPDKEKDRAVNPGYYNITRFFSKKKYLFTIYLTYQKSRKIYNYIFSYNKRQIIKAIFKRSHNSFVKT